MSKFILLCLAFLIIASCASSPTSYPPLETAKATLAKINTDENLKKVASVTLFQANELLNKAEASLENNNIEAVDHYIYLTLRKQEIAHELLLKHQHEQELVKLKQQHQEMVTHVRKLEAKRAYDKAEIANQRAKKLETTLNQYQAEETSRGTLLVINDLLFATGGAQLEAASENRLQPLLQYLQGNPRREIIIEGHTDSTGNANTNKRLSLERAESVKQFLVTHGIADTRIETRGFGQEVPVATNTTNAGRRLNRRVEIVIKNIAQDNL